MSTIYKSIAIILAIATVVLFLFNYGYRSKNRQLSMEVEALQLVNVANIRAIATLKRASETTEAIITVWSGIRDTITERQRENLSAIQKEIKENEDTRSWSYELVPDSFVLLLQQNSNGN